MSKSLSVFEKIDGPHEIFTARKGDLRCSAIRLETGGLVLFSPVQGLGEEAIASLQELGQVEYLLAPNHYHNKGLQEYQEAFPAACLCAPAGAMACLEQKTGLVFEGLERLTHLLSRGVSVLEPSGLKTGEIWISVDNRKHRTWFVVDAFSGPKGQKGAVADTPEVLGTFPRMGVADRTLYREWAEKQLAADNPELLVPCHGAVVRSAELTNRLRTLLRSKL